MEEYGSKLGHSITTLMWRMAHECIGKKEVSTLGEAAKDILYYGLCGKMTYEARFKAVRNLFKVIEGGDELYPKFHSAIVAIFDNITMKAMNFYMRQMVDEYTHSVLAKCHQTFPQNNGAEEDGGERSQ